MRKLALYSQLNELADSGGLVIFGGKTDQGIPMCELKQAFHLQDKLYNRSIDGLSVHNGAEYFDACVAPLKPKDVLLRIGEADREFFAENAAGFDKKLSAAAYAKQLLHPSHCSDIWHRHNRNEYTSRRSSKK